MATRNSSSSAFSVLWCLTSTRRTLAARLAIRRAYGGIMSNTLTMRWINIGAPRNCQMVRPVRTRANALTTWTGIERKFTSWAGPTRAKQNRRQLQLGPGPTQVQHTIQQGQSIQLEQVQGEHVMAIQSVGSEEAIELNLGDSESGRGEIRLHAIQIEEGAGGPDGKVHTIQAVPVVTTAQSLDGQTIITKALPEGTTGSSVSY